MTDPTKPAPPLDAKPITQEDIRRLAEASVHPAVSTWVKKVLSMLPEGTSDEDKAQAILDAIRNQPFEPDPSAVDFNERGDMVFKSSLPVGGWGSVPPMVMDESKHYHVVSMLWNEDAQQFQFVDPTLTKEPDLPEPQRSTLVVIRNMLARGERHLRGSRQVQIARALEKIGLVSITDRGHMKNENGVSDNERWEVRLTESGKQYLEGNKP